MKNPNLRSVSSPFRIKEVIVLFGIVNYGGFLVSSLLLNMTPGSDTVYVVSRSATGGKRQGILSALGISSGILFHTLLVSLGLSVVLAQSPLAFNILKTVGGAYLVLLGVRTFFAKATPLTATKEFYSESNKKIYLQGILTNALNPKVALFFLAFLPQYVAENAKGFLPFLLLGITFCCTSTVWSCLLAFCASSVSKFLNANEKISRISKFASGCIYIALGVRIFLTELS